MRRLSRMLRRLPLRIMRQHHSTLVLVDVENIYAQVFQLGHQLNFFKLKAWLEGTYGEVTIIAFGRFHEHPSNGVSFAVKEHLESVPSVTVIDTTVADKARKEVSDMALISHGAFGQFGVLRNAYRYERMIIMSGDGAFVHFAQYVKYQLGMDVLVISDKDALSHHYRRVGIKTAFLHPIERDLLVKLDIAAIDECLIDAARKGQQKPPYRGSPHSFRTLADYVCQQLPEIPQEIIANRINLLMLGGKLLREKRQVKHKEPRYVTIITAK